MINRSAAFAASRFGLGLRPQDAASFAGDPAGALLEEAVRQSKRPLDGDGLRPTPEILLTFKTYQVRQKQLETAMQTRATADGASMAMDEAGKNSAMMAEAKPQIVAYEAELAAKVARQLAAPIGVCERLVDFWSNHFAVEVTKSFITRADVGAYEREAIRPHVLGRFEDMLLAVARHPAMLAYLDNWQSVGVNSLAAKRQQGRGLNENFGRELMELHTLGVDGGYRQADVRALANALSGWSFGMNLDRRNEVGRFVFRPGMHEPGPITILGKTYRQKGERQGAAIIADLARHPATARHLSRKLVQSFVADDPPEALVARLADVFTKSDGNLLEVTRALLTAPASWEAPRNKLRSPQEFVVASARALDVRLQPKEARRGLTTLGHMYWQPVSPAGYPGDSRNWLAADAMTNRLDLAEYIAARARPVDPQALAKTVLGDLLSAPTLEAIRRAESPRQAYALMLMSPEFQRR
ncbi:DUF1800 domain-containing protein [Jiella endophytica]|uniref:DUF1800 domain-containing protein n=1 Tax=Jiella endophytica TaxID=2558362 RepID=A0A4Y8RNM3_9HYPH|nr:DUF1800 domain-containing protein [Jiella endophytica]TFF25263.1 DUF1800 domain-containing protein [Jiella endophytica]